MDAENLTALVDHLLSSAREVPSGRSARTVHGGRTHALKQTVIALAGGRALDDHESPGEATLYVLRGRVVLTSGEDAWEGVAGDLVVIPDARHRLDALADSAVLLTVVTATP